MIAAAKQLQAALTAAGSLEALIGQVYEGECLINDTTPLGAPVSNPKTHTAFCLLYTSRCV